MKKRSVSFWAGSVALAAAFGTPLLAFAQEKFVSLSGIPAFQNAGDASNLPQFLNQLYLICIGVAVVITVLQLIRAGIMYSMGDSGFAKIEEAKHLISISLLGLLLVLSPYIVFNIINPKILSLKIDTSGIQVKDDCAATQAPTNTQDINHGNYSDDNTWSTGTQLMSCSGNDCSAAKSQCAAKAPVGYDTSDPVVCVSSGGGIDPNGRTDNSLNAFSDYSCKPGETLSVNCSYTATNIK